MLILFAALALAGIVAILLIVLSEANKADDERTSNRRQIQVLAAATCELANRSPPPELKKELDEKGFVRISASCQRFVDLLERELLYEDGRIKLADPTNP